MKWPAATGRRRLRMVPPRSTLVKLEDVEAKSTVEYHIVGSAEANPAENKLSNESPVGKAIMGRK